MRTRSGGGEVLRGKPRLCMRRSISRESVMNALIFMAAPHRGQTSGSSSKTRFINAAQLALGLADEFGKYELDVSAEQRKLRQPHASEGHGVNR